MQPQISQESFAQVSNIALCISHDIILTVSIILYFRFWHLIDLVLTLNKANKDDFTLHLGKNFD